MFPETEIDIEKQSEKTFNQLRRDHIIDICEKLAKSSATFRPKIIYDAIREYKTIYNRWQYSYISQFIFNLNEEQQNTFLSNLDELQSYANDILVHGQLGPELELESEPEPESEPELKSEPESEPEPGLDSGPALEISSSDLMRMVDKLWDHSNLAFSQALKIKEDKDAFRNRFNECISPFKDEMNKQLISLIAIFTALSFIIFGGISSLDNIFNGAKSIPIIQLVIIGGVWSFCILNLVFTFIYLVSKLTGISIKDDEGSDKLRKKYPFWIWTNYLLTLILAVSTWLYYIDYSNSASWLLKFSGKCPMAFTIVGSIIIIIFFALMAKHLCNNKQSKKGENDDCKTTE